MKVFGLILMAIGLLDAFLCWVLVYAGAQSESYYEEEECEDYIDADYEEAEVEDD